MELKEFASYKSELSDLTNAVIAAQNMTLESQAKAAALIAEKSELEKEVVSLKAWEREAQRYELKEVASGMFAHAIKEALRGSEPFHQICSHCYQDNIKSIFQLQSHGRREDMYLCHRCKQTIRLPNTPISLPQKSEDWDQYS